MAPPLQLPWPTGVIHQIAGGNSYGCDTHTGVDAYAVDFALSINQPVSAAAAGRVHTVFNDPGYGNYAWIDHGALQTNLQGVASLYGHFRTNGPFAVTDGTLVKQGQVIGYADHTGYGTGDHLHFRMTTGGLWGTAYQPEPMSGASGFGNYGFSILDGTCDYDGDSPSWVSRSPLGRDATNDGCPDVFAREGAWPYVLRRYAGNCAGGLGPAYQAGSIWDPAVVRPIMGSTLFNSSSTPGQACADLLAREVTGAYNYRLRIYSGDCSGNYSSGSYTPLGSGWAPWLLDRLITAGDMTGDGCADLMAREAAPPYVMRMYPGTKSGGTCTGSLEPALAIGTGWNLNLIAAVGDVTGDGCFDVVAAENYEPFKLRVYSGDCAGGLNLVLPAQGSGWTPSVLDPIMGPGDFDGDGCGDLLVREVGGTQSLRLYPGSCDGNFTGPFPFGSGWSPTTLPDLIPH